MRNVILYNLYGPYVNAACRISELGMSYLYQDIGLTRSHTASRVLWNDDVVMSIIIIYVIIIIIISNILYMRMDMIILSSLPSNSCF